MDNARFALFNTKYREDSFSPMIIIAIFTSKTLSNLPIFPKVPNHVKKMSFGEFCFAVVGDRNFQNSFFGDILSIPVIRVAWLFKYRHREIFLDLLTGNFFGHCYKKDQMEKLLNYEKNTINS